MLVHEVMWLCCRSSPPTDHNTHHVFRYAWLFLVSTEIPLTSKLNGTEPAVAVAEEQATVTGTEGVAQSVIQETSSKEGTPTDGASSGTKLTPEERLAKMEALRAKMVRSPPPSFSTSHRSPNPPNNLARNDSRKPQRPSSRT